MKFCVIGAGRAGAIHARNLAERIASAELVALCDRDATGLHRLGEELGVPARLADFREAVARPDVDAVVIATPTFLHCEIAVAAAKQGKHVFLEKPMASTVADCRKIVRAAEQAAGSFMVGHICRFNPRYAAAKREIEAGKIGRIVSIYARRNIPAAVGATVLPKIGPIIGDGVHDTDLMLWYTGAHVVSAYAQTVDVRGLKYPDIGWTMYRFDTGAVGVLEDAWFLPDKTPFQIDERMEILGTEGSIHIHEVHPNLSICDKDGWHSPDTTYWPELHGIRAGALREELSYFAACVLEGKRPTVIRPEESLRAVEACLAAERSAATGRVVKLRPPRG